MCKIFMFLNFYENFKHYLLYRSKYCNITIKYLAWKKQ